MWRRCSSRRSGAIHGSGIRSTRCTKTSRDAAVDGGAFELEAGRALRDAFGDGGDAVTAWAPGRCTLLGEHVDYAGGVVLCIAIQLGIAVAMRTSPERVFRTHSGESRVVRSDPGPAGDIGDRIFAAAVALRHAGINVPPYDVAVAANLPSGAGLASSAAIVCAVIVAALRLTRSRLTAADVVDAALFAERDVVGVPCGSMDQHTIVEAPPHGALLLNCRDGSASQVRWPWPDVVLAACSTAEQHDVGGAAYRSRREETDRALAKLHVAGAQDITENALRGGHLPSVQGRRVRHVATETRRAVDGADAMRARDAARLGALMTDSHRSLRDDHEVSTPALDAVVEAALRVPGCFGARMVGAGFGGSVIALVERSAADACAAAMRAAAAGARGTWVLLPSPGLAHTAADVIGSG
jgi:galactokinase